VNGRPVVLVTGASRGIGAATAVELAHRGVDLVITARSDAGLRRTAEGIRAAGAAVLDVAGDVAAPGAAEGLATAVAERFGRLDALVNNASVLDPIAPLADVDPAELTRTLAIDVTAPLALVRATLPLLRAGRGRVLNVSSSAANLAIEGLGAYCIAKAALAMATRVLAAEEPDVTFLSVQPGPVDTDMHVALREDGHGISADRRAYYHRLREEGELLHPSVPAARFAWLALEAPRTWSGHDVAHDDPSVPTVPTAPPDPAVGREDDRA
jgi:NAD(P)-dependent dehydrogenase (short-subunit alcohol dehydrogenase family)